MDMPFSLQEEKALINSVFEKALINSAFVLQQELLIYLLIHIDYVNWSNVYT